MANWHQEQALKRNPIRMDSVGLWTVVTDTPTLLSLMRFDNQSDAVDHAAATGGYVLPPRPKGE